jgi:hypothetical protein
MAQINKPTDYFNTKLYSGNGSTQNITGLDFQPDWVWIKERTSTSDNMLYDAVRGATNRLESNTSDAEASSATQLNAFNSDGWTTGSSAGTNESGQTYASWNWLGANGTTSNTDGSITSTVSANTTSGFSIVKWSGNGTLPSTIGHGLGVAPKMIIVKQITANTYSWLVYHQEIGNTHYLGFNTTDAKDNSVNLWNNTSPTSSVFTVNHAGTNASGVDYIAYCFAEKKGFSKMGSYVGIASSDSNFVYLGFKPSFLLIKNASAGSTNWHLYDNKRLGYNVDNNVFQANTNSAELTNDDIDFLSNGFKLRRSTASNNGSGNTMIYMAFAAEPLVGTNNIPATAR